MKTNVLLIALLLICSTMSCSYTKGKKVELEKATVVAEKTTVNGSDLITCDVSKFNEVIDIPLSFFTEEMQIVKLDNRDEALVGAEWPTTVITENYILVRNNKQNPYKLFDKQGKFMTAIGKYGQGPNEYLNAYDEYLDETNGQILILPWTTNKILRFNLKGEAMDPIILPYNVPKGKIMVNEKEKTVSVVSLAFKGSVPLVAWKQDFNSNMLDSVVSGDLSVNPRNEKGQFVGYNNEVFSNKNTKAFDCRLTYSDPLYHYNGKAKFDAKFMLDFKDEPRQWSWFLELPDYFMGTLGKNKYIVNKETLKGSFFNLYNDFLGDMSVGMGISNGCWQWNVEPGALIDRLTKELEENKEMSKKDRKKLTDLLDSIDDNDNNYVFYAKLKQ